MSDCRLHQNNCRHSGLMRLIMEQSYPSVALSPKHAMHLAKRSSGNKNSSRSSIFQKDWARKTTLCRAIWCYIARGGDTPSNLWPHSKTISEEHSASKNILLNTMHWIHVSTLKMSAAVDVSTKVLNRRENTKWSTTNGSNLESLGSIPSWAATPQYHTVDLSTKLKHWSCSGGWCPAALFCRYHKKFFDILSSGPVRDGFQPKSDKKYFLSFSMSKKIFWLWILYIYKVFYLNPKNFLG